MKYWVFVFGFNKRLTSFFIGYYVSQRRFEKIQNFQIMKQPNLKVDQTNYGSPKKGNSRRQFLKIGSIAAVGSGLLLFSCSDDDISDMPEGVFDLGTGDVGVLNYAYALEQLEAAFYTRVLSGSYWMGAEANEKRILEDLRNHEVIHREFLKTAISAVVASNKVLPELEFDFSSIDFTNRNSVLNTAKLLEDTGVAAYNGAGKLLTNTDYLLIAGKIVSVEARHASAIRDLLNPLSADFAGDDVLVNIGGSGVAYDKATPPSDILAAVTSLNIVQTPFTANQLPTS